MIARTGTAVPPSRPLVRGLVLVGVALLLAAQAILGAPRVWAEPGGECANPPIPEMPSSGLTGAIDPSLGQGLAGSMYVKYGYAGQVWHTYDVGDGMFCSAPNATIDTWVGNKLFSAAKVIVATVNSLHYMINEGGLGDQFDQLVKTGAQATFDAAGPFLVLALLLAGIGAFWYVLRGDNSGVAKTGGRVALGLTLIAATAFSPLLYTNLFDKLILSGFQKVQAEISQTLYQGKDGEVVYRHVLPTTLHRELVYENWLRGEFGSAESETAQTLGPKLLAAQACSWSQTRSGTCDIEAKQDKFVQVAKKIKKRGNYAVFTGKNSGRVGIGALALTEAVVIGGLQIVAKLGILLGQLVLRVFVLFGPLIGILCLLPGVGRNVLRGVLGVGALALVFNIVAGIHTYLFIKIMGTDLPLMGKLAALILITGLIWAVLRPVKRLKAMMASSMYTMPGESAHRVGQWLQHAHLMRAMRRKSSGDDKRWWHQRGKPSPSGDASEGEEHPGEGEAGTVWAAATVLRPEGATHAASAGPVALPAATTAAGTRGSGTSGSGRGGPSPSPPRGGQPPGDAPGGTGTAATPPADSAGAPPPIRVESTRLWEPDGSLHQSQLGTGQTSEDRGLPGGAGATPTTPGQEPSRSDSPEVGQDRSELITPTEILAADQGPDDVREAPAVRDDQGHIAHGIFNPQTGNIEVDTGPDAPAGPRPETGSPSIPNTTEPGTNRGGADADPY